MSLGYTKKYASVYGVSEIQRACSSRFSRASVKLACLTNLTQKGRSPLSILEFSNSPGFRCASTDDAGLRKYNVDIACFSDVRIPDSGHSMSKVPGEEACYHLYHSGVVNNTGTHGVANYPCEVDPPTLVYTAIRRLRNNGAPGGDGILAEVNKMCLDSLSSWLHWVIAKVWLYEAVPN